MPESQQIHTRERLSAFHPRHATLVGVDSDGCVFDTMEVKQRRHFQPLIVSFWGLEAIEPQLRQAAEFFNLHSKWRGTNRFAALLQVFKALPDMPGVRATGVALPPCRTLEAYVASGLPLGNPSLRAEVERTGDPDLKRVLDWSLAINRDIDDRMPPIAPFGAARRALETIARRSDVIVVSQTPEAALVKEWEQHGLASYVRFIAGQELGAKDEQLHLAASGRYAPDRVLMIGDAPGDLAAARRTDACFYPIEPGREEACWQRLHDEAYDRFLDGAYCGAYQQRLLDEFEAMLPDTPPWV